MSDDYETLLELARQWQRFAAQGWKAVSRAHQINARDYAEARALYAGAEALRREREWEAEADTLRKRVQAFAAEGGVVILEYEVAAFDLENEGRELGLDIEEQADD